MYVIRKAIIGVSLLLLISCNPIRRDIFYDISDLTPPLLESAGAVTAQQIDICFDEPVMVVEDSVRIDGALVVTQTEVMECGVALQVNQPLVAGRAYRVGIAVSDHNGNSLDVVTEIYGYNPTIPALVINEFTTRGSKNHPDLVELYLLEDGNVGGITLYNGSANNWSSRKVLPNLTLSAGQYILVHFKPEGIPEEVDETLSPNSSGGKDAHSNAWDFWVEEGKGLSGNNGLLTLYSNPYGMLLDAAPYSNRTSDSDSKYRGFGSRALMNQVDEIVAAGGWQIAEGQARPEDLIFSDHGTATRSLNRDSSANDSDHANDWHTVPTSGYSFGEVNSDERHTPRQ